MFKPYFTYKGQRMGWQNPIKTSKGEEPFIWWRLRRAMLLVAVLISINALVYKAYTLTKAPIWLFATIALCVIWVSYSICFLLHNSKVKCKYCSIVREHAERFVAKKCAKYHLPADSHEIVLENGWYMVYRNHKPPKA